MPQGQDIKWTKGFSDPATTTVEGLGGLGGSSLPSSPRKQAHLIWGWGETKRMRRFFFFFIALFFGCTDNGWGR